MATENVFDYEQDNPVQTPTVGTTPNTDAASDTSTTTTPVMNEQEALQQIPDKVTYGQIAVAQQANPLSPSLLNKFDQDLNKDWYAQQQTTPSENNSLPLQPTLEDHPDFIKSLGKVKDEQRFTIDGQEYFRHGGAIYKAQNSIPNVGERLSPEDANRLERERARRLMDPPLDSDVDGPGEAIASAAAKAGLLAAAGAASPEITIGAGASFIGRSLFGIGNNYRKEQKK